MMVPMSIELEEGVVVHWRSATLCFGFIPYAAILITLRCTGYDVLPLFNTYSPDESRPGRRSTIARQSFPFAVGYR